jgi:oxygen-dependent protoporphyrinogen oxidase
VILATTAPEAGTLLGKVAPDAARSLASVDYSASGVVLMRFAHGTLGRPLDASGYLVAPEEEAVVTACSFLPAKWPHLRDPAGLWLRAVVTDPGALALPDEGLKHRVAVEVGATMRARGGADPVLLHRWPRALPVFRPWHRERIASVRAALPREIALAGAFVDGVGIPDCIRTGEDAAREVVHALRSA